MHSRLHALGGSAGALLLALSVVLVLVLALPAAGEEDLPTQSVHRVLKEVKLALAGIPVRIEWMEAAIGRVTMRVTAADETTLDKVGPALKENAYLKSRATVPQRGFVRGEVKSAGKRVEADFFLHFKHGTLSPEPRGDVDPKAAIDEAGKDVGVRVLYASRGRGKDDTAAQRRVVKQDLQLEAFDAEGKSAEPTVPQLERLFERIGTHPRMQLTFVAWYRVDVTPERPDPGDSLKRVSIQVTTWEPLDP